jgi:hypothetical protein
MWKFLSNIFGSPGSSSSQVKASQTVPATAPQAECNTATTASLDLLWSKVSHLSNAEHRFLHPTYSPSSRVPCADFTSFIIERLKRNDVGSIRQLMRAIIAGNPGLGIGPEWIDELVHEIAGLDFTRYYRCDNPDFTLELKALFILGAKEGGDREFWLADEKPLLFAFALCCHDIQWLDGMEQLRDKANRFIRRMRKDTPFWETYPLFGPSLVPPQSVNNSPVVSKLLALPLLSRIHVHFFAERGAGSLMQSTTYRMRSLGVNPRETAQILLESGICQPASDHEALAEVFSKNGLVAALDERAIPYRKSWGKRQLLGALSSHAPEFLAQVAERERTARIRPELLPDLRFLNSNAHKLQEGIKLLCFATSAT